MANAEQRANSAKEDKNLMQDVISLLSDDYSKIILVLPKRMNKRNSHLREGERKNMWLNGFLIHCIFYILF